MKNIIVTVLAIFILTISVTAEAKIYIPIDQPSDQLFPIAVPNLRGGGDGRKIADVIRNDMKLSGYMEVLDPDHYKDVAKKEGITAEGMRFAFWSSLGAHAVVKGEVTKEGGEFVATMRLFDTFGRAMIVGKQYKATKKDLRKIAHRFSDEIMLALTGARGVFNTKIAYTAVTGKWRKGVYVMDMDGHGPFSITRNKAINISPSWSPDGSKLVFTSYERGFPDLYVKRIGGGGMKKITKNHCTNITPAWSPSGSPIAFSSSINGPANLYTITPGGGRMRRVTNTGSIDISPSWSPGGNTIVFASERAGGLHLYKTSPGGGGTQRLTFVGYQNDMPDWSPQGDKIVFAGRDMGTFDIFIMNAGGGNIQRLTVAAGSNEHPSFSPDGRYVTFSSTREGGAAVYIMRADGANQVRVSKGNGLLPSWGPQGK